ncbi:MAG TPA: hypothetical protein VNW89_06050 [Stellaceae bacterium]|jgi:hypothetical protein|nr:hypothetical protein [Stellaceae bacterium]
MFHISNLIGNQVSVVRVLVRPFPSFQPLLANGVRLRRVPWHDERHGVEPGNPTPPTVFMTEIRDSAGAPTKLVNSKHL